MSTLSPTEQFFASLTQELDRSEYAQRLQQELRDHVEDSVYEHQLEGIPASEISSKVIEQLGNPKLISTEFKRTMRQHTIPYLYARLLLVSMVSVPLMFICATALFQALSPLFFYLQHQPQFRSLLTLFEITITACGSLSGLILYRLTVYDFYVFLKNEPKSYHRIGLATTLFSVPILIILAIFWYKVNIFSSPIFLVIILFFAYFLIILKYFQWQERRIFNKIHKHDVTVMRKIRTTSDQRILGGLALSVIGLIIYTAVSPAFIHTSNRALELRHALEIPLLRLAPMIVSFFRGYVEDPTIMISGYVLTAWCAIIIGIWAGYYLVHYAYTKYITPKNTVHFPWVALTLLTYVLSLFLSIQPKPVIQWHVPVQDITAQVERTQYGLWRNFIATATYGNSLISYGVMNCDRSSDTFFLTLGSDTAYSLSRIQSVKTFQFQEDQLPDILCGPLPNYIAPEFTIVTHVNQRNIQFNGTTIADATSTSLNIQTTALTRNNQFALLVLYDDFTANPHIYLADLRGIQ